MNGLEHLSERMPLHTYLDSRQRAMLAEMGVRVWLPKTSAIAPVVAPVAASVAAPAAAPAFADAPAHQAPTTRISTSHQPQHAAPPVKQQTTRPTTQQASASVPIAVAVKTLSAQAKEYAQARVLPLPADKNSKQGGVDTAALDDAAAASVAKEKGLPRWLFVVDGATSAMLNGQHPLHGQGGQAGQLLVNMATAICLQNGQAFYSCISPSAPLAEQIKHMGNNTEIDQYAQLLQQEIACVQPQIVFAMGRFAAISLLKNTAVIGQLRGQQHQLTWLANHGSDRIDSTDSAGAVSDTETTNPPVVVSYSLSYLLRNAPAKRLAWQDLCMAKALVSQTG